MTAATKINNGGTWVSPASIKINDAGTWRVIHTIKVNDSGTWRKVYPSKFTTSGTFVSTSLSFNPVYYRGYGDGCGNSMSPATLPDGKTIIMILKTQSGVFALTVVTTIQITGFVSDPGANYFASITVNSVTQPYSFFTYSYSAGTAQWSYTAFNTSGDVFNMPASGSVSWTLTDYG